MIYLSPALLLEEAIELPSISGCVKSFGMRGGGLDLACPAAAAMCLPGSRPAGMCPAGKCPPTTCIRLAGVEVHRISLGLKGLKLELASASAHSETSDVGRSHVSFSDVMSPAEREGKNMKDYRL